MTRRNRSILAVLSQLLLTNFLLAAANAFLIADFSTPFAVHSKIALAASSSPMPPSESSKEKTCASKGENDIAEAEKRKLRKRSLYSFSEARKIARGHGFSDRDEFLEYDCPGAYQLPKNADEVWADDWTSWEDFLGITLKDFEEAREVARTRVGGSSTTRWKASTEAEYLELFRSKEIEDGDIASRLPFRPDLYYKNKGWVSWEDFLLTGKE